MCTVPSLVFPPAFYVRSSVLFLCPNHCWHSPRVHSSSLAFHLPPASWGESIRSWGSTSNADFPHFPISLGEHLPAIVGPPREGSILPSSPSPGFSLWNSLRSDLYFKNLLLLKFSLYLCSLCENSLNYTLEVFQLVATNIIFQ